MPKKKKSNLLGAIAFLIGVILAVLFAFIPTFMFAGVWLTWALVVIGIVIGLLNIGDSEIQPFLLAGVVLVIVSSFGGGVFAAIPFLSNILGNLLSLFVPATIIVALKSVFSFAKR
jgi:hypothetical protein